MLRIAISAAFRDGKEMEVEIEDGGGFWHLCLLHAKSRAGNAAKQAHQMIAIEKQVNSFQTSANHIIKFLLSRVRGNYSNRIIKHRKSQIDFTFALS
jgi:hypothetical protein